MPLIHCKVEFSLKWYENCILSNAGDNATFIMTDTKIYVPIVTLCNIMKIIKRRI